MILIYFWKFSKMKLTKSQLIPRGKYAKEIAALGMASGINQVAMGNRTDHNEQYFAKIRRTV